MPPATSIRTGGGQVSVTEIVIPPYSAGPPLHLHDFDEAFYLLEGELIFQVEQTLATKGAGELTGVRPPPTPAIPRAVQAASPVTSS